MANKGQRNGKTNPEGDTLDIGEAELTNRVTDLVDRGLERYACGDMDGALSEWEHALALDPDCAKARECSSYVRREFSSARDRSETARGAQPAALAELDVPFGLELVGARAEFDLEPYEAMEVTTKLDGPLDMALPAGYEIDHGWEFDVEPTGMAGAAPAVGAELAAAIEDVTAGLMSIQSSPRAQVDKPTRPRPLGAALPAEAFKDLKRTQARPEDKTAQRPTSDYELDLGSDGDDLNELPLEAESAPLGTLDLEPDSGDELELKLGPAEELDSSWGQPVVSATEKPAPAVQISFRTPGLKSSPELKSSPPAVEPYDPDQTAQRPAPTRPLDGRAPTQDPTLLAGAIDIDDNLLQLDQATGEHTGLYPPPVAEERQTIELDQATGEHTALYPSPVADDRQTIEIAQARPAMLGEATSYDEIAGDLLNDIELGGPAESRDERTRRRVTALIERANSETRDGKFARAVVAVDLALQEDPESAAAQKVIHRHRDALVEIYRCYIGNLAQIPALAMPMHELKLHEINHRAAFLLSRIDGVLSFEDILDICGMSRLEAFRHLSRLVLQGVLEVR